MQHKLERLATGNLVCQKINMLNYRISHKTRKNILSFRSTWNAPDFWPGEGRTGLIRGLTQTNLFNWGRSSSSKASLVQGTTHDGVTLQSSGTYIWYNWTQSSQSINCMLALESWCLPEVLGGVLILGIMPYCFLLLKNKQNYKDVIFILNYYHSLTFSSEAWVKTAE